MPAKAEAAATLLVFFKNCRRVVLEGWLSMCGSLWFNFGLA